MIDTALVAAIRDLGALGFLVIGIGALVFRWVHPRGEVADREKVWAERLAELRMDRDEWRTLATSFGAKVDRLTDVVELLSDRKVP